MDSRSTPHHGWASFRVCMHELPDSVKFSPSTALLGGPRKRGHSDDCSAGFPTARLTARKQIILVGPQVSFRLFTRREKQLTLKNVRKIGPKKFEISSTP